MKFDSHAMVLLVRPPDAPEFPEDEAARLQDAHLAHQSALYDRGLVVAAGPLRQQDDDRLRGVVLLSVDAETARELYSQDPAVRAGWLAVQVQTWMVPAGQLSFNEVRLPASAAEAQG